ncbi:sodium channel protein Nach-like isoform X3 [Osmia bicornis bicornis]|uniref:sodium channel protein Nach-like isoform X3 n=1 Tax=Osmia bicornis bicornis TaxID=1437191 RepID=UPI001EAF2FFA|nr:sodium channel protein Nach-like isoform X3 [Osmia bicornis bicornis]
MARRKMILKFINEENRTDDLIFLVKKSMSLVNHDKYTRRKLRWNEYCERILRKCGSILKKQTFEFCRETSLHGYKYIAETRRSMPERIAWAITVLISLVIAIVIMKFTYDYYSDHATLSVIESTHRGIWNYPFPAVTVCDFNRVSLKLTRQLVEKLKLPPTVSKEFIIQEMKLLNELLYPGEHELNIRSNLTRLQVIFDMNGLSIPTVINLVTRSCNNLLGACKWKAKEKDCKTIFQPSFTRYGMCCSFNYITRENILEEPNLQPHRMTSCGYQSGLNILLNLDPDDYHASLVKSIGAKIMLHSPFDYPDDNAASKLLPVNKYSFLIVQPEEMYSTDNVRRESTRYCIFHDEIDAMNGENKKKRYFIPARYSVINCLVECRASVIQTKCGCIPYYYPQNNARVCNLRDLECVETYKYWYDTAWPGTDMSPNVVSLTELNTNERPCNCHPDCNFYAYQVQNSIGNLNERIYYTGLSYTNYPSKGKAWKNQSVIHIFFGDLVSIQYRRDIRYSWRHVFGNQHSVVS